jgi:succinate dehydrogenase / fumarate reductase cytochrome b subunit
MNYKYVEALSINESRYWEELHAKFADLWRVIFYVVSFVLLGLHLSHGFQSSFQSIGARHPKYLKCVNTRNLVFYLNSTRIYYSSCFSFRNSIIT